MTTECAEGERDREAQETGRRQRMRDWLFSPDPIKHSSQSVIILGPPQTNMHKLYHTQLSRGIIRTCPRCVLRESDTINACVVVHYKVPWIKVMTPWKYGC